MIRGFRWTVLTLLLVVCTWGQDNHPRIEVQHYTIDADINPRTQSIVATAKLNFTPLDDANEAVFDSLIAGLRQRSSELASLRNQQSAGVAAEFGRDEPQRAA